MQAYLTQIVTRAAEFLPDLMLVGIVAVALAIVVTGPGGRIAIRVEDLLYRRRVARTRT